MKFYALTTAILALLTGSTVDARMYDDRFRLEHPLSNSTFKHWKSSGTAVFLERKTVLTPELPGAVGLIFAKNAFQLHSFSLEIDLSIHNRKRLSLAQGAMHIYLLRDNPMQTAQTFADGLDGQFDGLRVTIEEGAVKNPDRSRHAAQRLHKISIVANDENYIPEKTAACQMDFEDQTLIIATQDAKKKLIVATVDPHEKDPAKKEKICAQIDIPDEYFADDHETFIFIAAKAGEQHPNEHIIHHIRFKDIKHLHDDEEINTPEDEKPFHGKAADVLRTKALQSNSAHTISSYNHAQVKHNELYSTLVAKFIANSERVIANLDNLPDVNTAQEINRGAEKLNERFSLLQKQFNSYNKDLAEYKDFVKELVERRDTERSKGNPEDEAYIEQDNLVNRLDRYLNTIDEFKKTIDAQHLKKEILDYEKRMKEFDQHYLRGDKQMLSKLGQNKRHDEKLSETEMETLFSQQVRGVFSKQFRSYEQQIQGNQKYGNGRGLAGSVFVDYVAFIGLAAVLVFAFFAYKKLQEQKDTLVL